MRKNILFALVISLYICFSGSSLLYAAGVSQGSNEMKEAESTVESFLLALMSGDVDGMKTYISSEYYDKNRVLLDDNTEYPSFLAGHYQGTKMLLRSISMVDDVIEAEAEISFPDKTGGTYVIYLKQEGDDWKIEEINELSRDRFERIRKKERQKSKLPQNRQ